MKEIIIIIIIMTGIFTSFWIGGYLIKRFTAKEDALLPQRRILTTEEAEWLADYFHNKEDAPDIDGYTGRYFLPEEAVKKYAEKYAEQRGWK